MTATISAGLPIHDILSRPQMDDRKRALAADSDDLAPSRKRIVKDENGQQMRLDADKEKEIENYQKDAILRQMKEYKRNQKHYEDLYSEASRKLLSHDSSLRTVDAWLTQLLDELRILAGEALPTPPPDIANGGEVFKSALSTDLLSSSLQSQSTSIKQAISDIFRRIPPSSPQLQALQEQLADVLAKEKVMLMECQRLTTEKEQLTERLENASYRYMKAERSLDRIKSQQVQKLEQQAYASANANGSAASPVVANKASTPVKREASENGELENGIAASEAELARAEAVAVAQSRKRQLEEIEAENERLTNELSAARTKVASLTGDDYAETAVFKSMKSQYEDVIKRINDLEATNIQLREDAQKLHNERTSYRLQVDEEVRGQISESEAQIARCEVDLARVRNNRDELAAEVSVRKAAEDNRRTAADQARELAEARDRKIKALEAELGRLKLQLGEIAVSSSSEHLEGLTADELKAKLLSLEQQHSLLGQELPSMEEAWSKASAIASRKVADAAETEEKLSRLSAEKVKADQKYFQAMKAKDTVVLELRVLKTKDSRSAEIVSQLKEADIKTRELITTLERQLVEMKAILTTTDQQYRSSEQKQVEAEIQLASLKKQLDELKAMTANKDNETLALKKAKREVEDALESCTARLEEGKKQMEVLRKSTKGPADGTDDWRRVAICPVCNLNIRNTFMKGCGHVFCNSCVSDLMTNRNRKCPVCGKGFGANDAHPIILT